MQHYYFFEGLIILLGVALLLAIIKYPKDALITLPLGILSRLLRPLLGLVWVTLGIIAVPMLALGKKYHWGIVPWLEKLLDLLGDNDKSEDAYPASSRLQVNFASGDKYILVVSSKGNSRELINSLVDFSGKDYGLDDFLIHQTGQQELITCPRTVHADDYYTLVHLFTTELGPKVSFGVFRSPDLTFYVYGDSKTLNNLVGFTGDNKLFSIYLFDETKDMNRLRVSHRLKVESDWIAKLVDAVPKT